MAREANLIHETEVIIDKKRSGSFQYKLVVRTGYLRNQVSMSPIDRNIVLLCWSALENSDAFWES